MALLGRLIFKELLPIRNQDASFYRLVVLVEQGFKAEHRKVSAFDETLFSMIESLTLGTYIKLSTYKTVSGYENVSKVELIELTSCSYCSKFLEMTDGQQTCSGCIGDGVKNERIDGIWSVKAKRDYLSPSQLDQLDLTESVTKKLLLCQESNMLGFVTFPKTPFFDVLVNTKVGETIELSGWRDEHRHLTVSDVIPLNKSTYLKNINLDDSVECLECSKQFKNKNSLKSHRSLFHK